MTTQADTLQTETLSIIPSTDSISVTLCGEQDTTLAVVKDEGFEGIPRYQNNSYNNSLLIFLIFSFFVIFVAISRKKISLRTIISNKEESKDEVRHTIIDLITTMSLCTITVITYAMTIIYLTSDTTLQASLTIKNIATISGVVGAAIAIQQTLLWIIGKLFFDRNETKRFLKENITYYTIPAIILTPTIALYILSIYNTNMLIYIALAIAFTIRLTFVIRNINIFKHTIGTTCYNILYLCTAEIMPIAIIFKWALNS
ncbi:MAG: DUF4271 domain-containing protein [Muribaculaceae bacterium]|nr:DUF4271 domain-containing protein [Muribaculaceae bacterium]